MWRFRLLCHGKEKVIVRDLPQLQHAPIKFGRFIKLNNINVKVLYKQVDIGFAAEAVLERGGKGAFCLKKGCNAPSAGYGFLRKKNSPQAQYVL